MIAGQHTDLPKLLYDGQSASGPEHFAAPRRGYRSRRHLLRRVIGLLQWSLPHVRIHLFSAGDLFGEAGLFDCPLIYIGSPYRADFAAGSAGSAGINLRGSECRKQNFRRDIVRQAASAGAGVYFSGIGVQFHLRESRLTAP